MIGPVSLDHDSAVLADLFQLANDDPARAVGVADEMVATAVAAGDHAVAAAAFGAHGAWLTTTCGSAPRPSTT